MPLYDYECPKCEIKQKDVFVHRPDAVVKCAKCKTVMKRLLTIRFHAKVFPADGVFLEHVSAKGHTFHSEKEMKQWEKDNNSELGYLL